MVNLSGMLAAQVAVMAAEENRKRREREEEEKRKNEKYQLGKKINEQKAMDVCR